LLNLGSCLRRSLVLLFAATTFVSAAGQAAEHYNGLKWRLIGPFRGGRAVAVAGVPGNSTTFYFGSVDGGVWQTTDAGTVWRPIFDHEPIASIGAVAVAPSDPKVLYAGTGESDIRSDLSSGDGVYKSSDGGETWSNVGLRDSRQISRIVIDPHNADIAYVAVLGHAYGSSAERGVYKTTDGGSQWTRVLDQGPDIGAADLAIAGENPNILFATMWHAHRPPWSVYGPLAGPGSGLFRSLDGGQSWTRVAGSGLPDGDWGRSGVAVSPDGKRVYALIDAPKAGLYRSDDGGDTWSLVNSDPRLTSRSWYFMGITIDPSHPDVIYMPNVALYRSEDAGKTIEIVRGAPGGDDYHQLWVDPRDSARMILGTDQGTTISVDYGKTWTSWYNQPTAQLYHVITDDRFPYNVFGSQQDSGGIALPSRTDHGQITARDWFSPGGSESGYVAPDPKDPDIIYLSGTYGSVDRFDRRTSFSQNITPWPVPNWGTEIQDRKYRDPWTPVLLFSPFDKKTLYLGSQFVMKTTDGGLHWETISPDLTGATRSSDNTPASQMTIEDAKTRGFGVVFTIAPSGLSGEVIWAGSDTGLIHVTRDGGRVWKDVTPNGLGAWSKVSMIEASRFDPAEAYAAVDRHTLDDQRPYLYRTRDYGATWQLITSGIPSSSFVHAVRQDPKDRDLLFAGTELGIYFSFDDGDRWQSLQLNLPVTSIRDMTVHGNDLVIATHGRSFWILDDITSLRQLRRAAEHDTWLYSPAPAVRVDNDFFLGTPLPPEEPAAANPPSGAIVDYYLKSAASVVTLEILDSKGNLIRSISSAERRSGKHRPAAIADRWFPKPQILEAAAGMHRYVWDLAWNPKDAATEASGDDEEYGAPRGPRVVPGTYQVRLTVDGKSLTQPLEVVKDPRSPASAADFEQQFQLAQKMFSEAMLCRAALSEIHKLQSKVTAERASLQSQNAELDSSLAQLQESLKRIVSGGGPHWGDSMGLDLAASSINSALYVVESGNRPAPSQAVTVFDGADHAAKLRMEEWSKIKAALLPHLNDQLKQANQEPLPSGPSSEMD